MNFKFLFLLFFCFVLETSAQAKVVEGIAEDEQEQEQEEQLDEGYYEISPEVLEKFIEAEEDQLKKLNTQHEYNLKNLPNISTLPKGHENADEINKLALFIVKMMIEGNYKNHENIFKREDFRTFFGERSYGQIQDFLKKYTEQNKSLDTFYLLETGCTPKVDKVSVGDKSKRWKLSLVADYISIHKYYGSLLTLENSLIDHSSKWDKTQFLISMDVRNRENDVGKNRYQFRNISFKEVTSEMKPNIEHLLVCSDREKLLHEIAIYDSKSIKAEARIKALKIILDYLKKIDPKLMEHRKPFGDLDLNLND